MKMDIPPKTTENIFGKDLEKKFKSYIEKRSINPKNFKEMFSTILSNNKLFNQFSNNLEDLLNFSIEESWVVDENNDYSDNADEKIMMALENKTGLYLNNIFLSYKNANFSEKIKILDFLQNFYNKAIYFNNSYSRKKISEFFNQSLEVEAKEEGNYYIFLHLNQLKNMKESSSYSQVSPDRFMNERFIYNDKDFKLGINNIFDGKEKIGQNKLFLSEPKDFEKIKSLKEEFLKLKNQRDLDKNSNNFNQENISKIKKLVQLMDEYFTTQLDESYFNSNNKMVGEGDNEDKYLNYDFFRYKSVRDNFKERAGFSLEENSLPEQYNYFEYTKEITNKESNRFFSFLKKYQIKAFRTFLSIEQGGKEMGDKIMALGEKLPEDIAKEIFEGYSHLIDSSENLKTTLSKAFENENDPVLKNVPAQIKEALLARAKDVLIGAHKIATIDKTKLNHQDVLRALEGITLILDILSDIDKQKAFEFSKTQNTEKNLFKFSIEDKNKYKYDLKIFIRPIAEANAQARINIELSFDTVNPNKKLQEAFYNETHFIGKDKIDKGSKLRIGVDRDTYGKETMVSLDLGRSEHSGAKFERTGDVLGKLMVEASDSSIGHHTTEFFDKELAKEEVFEKLSKRLQEYLSLLSN